MKSEIIVSAPQARRLFMHGQGLLGSDARPCTASTLYRVVEKLGFVQLDSISVVERAHHHILATRFRSYSPALLDRLHVGGRLFEHMTHDASLIPSIWFHHWRHRFSRTAQSAWWREKLGPRPERMLREIRGRIEREGPLMARHFEDPREEGGVWWDWKPAKFGLEYLWRTGELAVARRDRFQKVYDLTERVLPTHHDRRISTRDEYVNWACQSAMERLAVATAGELVAFWRAITIAEARQWLRSAIARGEILSVKRESLSGRREPAFALADWRKRLKRTEEASPDMRLLSPFDPLVRDRRRCLQLFGFDYRFEAFVPAPKRRYGYYVLPVLQGESLVARLDPKLDRDSGVLSVLGFWWEPGVRVASDTLRQLEHSLDRYAAFVGASSWRLSPLARRSIKRKA
ncbi:MAG: YcaQ family DNA glycosylase [Deltaproteobacteria bacterium]|nr:YcaQ family DNA glycosylase [Deltaproteobacteria bacterium]